MRRAFVLIAALLLAAFGPDPEDTPTVEGAIARAMVNALPGPDEVEHGYEWWAVGARMTYRVHWHLAPRDSAGASHVRRTGWVDGDDDHAGIAACGDEQVRLFSFHLNESAKDVQSALLRALTEEAQGPPEVVGDAWRIAPSWTTAGLMRIEGQCTPAGSAALRRCWTDVYFALRENDRDAFALECRAP